MAVLRSWMMRSSFVTRRLGSQWKAFRGSLAAGMHLLAASSHCSTALRSCVRVTNLTCTLHTHPNKAALSRHGGYAVVSQLHPTL